MTSARDIRFGRALEWSVLLIAWLILVAAMLYGFRDAIAQFRMPDPDDALRLVQVRDLMAGQGFYDLTQYRINPAGGGGELHWSRFIDVQLAALIWLFQHFLPQLEAERWATSLYPLFLLLPVLLVFRRLLAHLGDREFVIGGILVAATTFSFLHYFVPLRIDHHNWQFLLSLVMLWLALARASFVCGLAAALVIAMHVEISLEGLPYLVIFGGLFALDWVRRPETGPRLAGFGFGLATLVPLWIGIWRGVDALTAVYCDAFSRPYLVGAMATGLTLWAVLMLPQRRLTTSTRLALLAIAGGVGAAAFLLAGSACLNGPFGNLSPLVREYWYNGISEGRPIWALNLPTQVSFAGPSLIGFACLLWSARRMAGTVYGENWMRLVLVAACSIILSLLVLRTTAVTHAYLVAGYVPIALIIFRWGRGLATPIQRIPATAATVLATPVTVSALAIAAMMPLAPDTTDEMPTDCITPAALARLNSLPASTIFTPLDIAPAILVGTPHRAIASGHHRNHRAMEQVIRVFLSADAGAEPIVRASGATYLALCRNMPEHENFVMRAPQGLSARLERGQVPAWLRYDAARSLGYLRVYRILPNAMPE